MAGQPPRADEGDDATADRRYVSSLLHGLMILDMFSRDRQEISIGEMAVELDLHKSSASRLAATFAHAGYLQPTARKGSYRLGGRIAGLGELMRHSLDLVGTVTPHLERLSAATGETGHLGVIRGTDATTLAVTEGWHTIRMHSWVGKTSPAYVSSMGKALLAGLAEQELQALFEGVEFQVMTENTVRGVHQLERQVAAIRERGHGLDDEELEIGMRCVSAPIADSSGTAVASISVSGPSQRMTLDVIPELAQHVRWHAARASRSLGSVSGVPDGWPPPPPEPGPLSYLDQARRPPIQSSRGAP
jgi:DNA-binding IclR family transcriptional regulator